MADNPPALEMAEAQKEESEVSAGISYKTPTGEDFVHPLTYTIEPTIPKRYQRWFRYFEPMISNILPNANIRREDIPICLEYFDSEWLKLKARGVPLPWETRTCFRFAMLTQLSRAVDGFERRIQRAGIGEGRERIEEMEEEKKSRWPF